jgi:hypothetical protein
MTRIATSIRGLPLFIALASAGLAACAPSGDPNRVTSSAPTIGADVVGGSDKTDEIYRQIYVPGDPNWSH